MQMQPISREDVIALARRMANNPADSVTLASQLSEMVRALPPDASEILSRPAFDRASLWTLGQSFENLDTSQPVPPQEIRIPHDMWIRGVVGQAYPKLNDGGEGGSVATLLQKLRIFRALTLETGTNGLGLFDSNWRLDGKQGFISSGMAEILGPGATIMGDGFWYAPMDWKLQKNQVIEIRMRSRMANVFPTTITDSDADRVLRWVSVCFWCEELDQPNQ